MLIGGRRQRERAAILKRRPGTSGSLKLAISWTTSVGSRASLSSFRLLSRVLTRRRYLIAILLIGTKSDLRSDDREIQLMGSQGQHPIEPAEGEQVAREIGARRYLECSAKLGRGVEDVFDVALREALGKGVLKEAWKTAGTGQTARKRKCVLL